MNPVKQIYLYADDESTNLDYHDLISYLKSKFKNIKIELRNDFLTHHVFDGNSPIPNHLRKMEQDDFDVVTSLAYQVVNCKVRNINERNLNIKPMMGEVNLEKKYLVKPESIIPGILYDGIRLHNLYQNHINGSELGEEFCHVIITPRLLSSFDTFDKRYHARAIICGFPCIISTSGIIEAPAKPKEYYKLKNALISQGIITIDEFMPDQMRSSYLAYDDPRINEVIKGYLMQAIFYHLITDPFCSEPKCRLFNAHWQSELLSAQLKEPEFCKLHQDILEKLNNKINFG
jgi:hypothetical protein